MKSISAFLAATALLAGCATGGADAPAALLQFVTVDLNAAKANFEAAGMTTESACVQSLIDLVGAEAAAHFEVRGLVSAGSVAYIKYARLRGTQQAQVSEECYAVLGKINMAALREGAHGIIP